MAPTTADLQLEHLLLDIADGVATVTLNHPERLNALDHGPGSMHGELADLVEVLGRDESVRCIVVRGSGRAFSSGGSLPPTDGGPPGADALYEFLSTEDVHNEAIRNSPTPIFAAVHGFCYGAALMMALHLDFIVAEESARLGFIETRFGSTGVETVSYFVGPQHAKFLALTGELVDAPYAERIGLIVAALPDEEFDDRVRDLARRIAAMPAPATVNNRRLINAAMDGYGWAHQKQLARALNSVTNATDAIAVDGRSFAEIRSTGGMAEFKTVRDGPFLESWLRG